MKKWKILLVWTVVLCLCLIKVHAADNDVSNYDDIFIALDKDGNVTHTSIEDISRPNNKLLDELQDVEYQIVQTHNGQQEVIKTLETKEEADKLVQQLKRLRNYNSQTIASITNYNTTEGIVVFGNKGSTTDYVNADTGVKGYLATSYGPDAAYLGTENGLVKFRIAGVTGLVASNQVYVVDYNSFVSKGLKTSTYTTSQGRIYHNITTDLVSHQSTQLVGYQQSYMSNNATYYSYDGHYFYTDYRQMLKDYKNNTHINSINPLNPYYNYYQYLSHRSLTQFTSAQIDEYLLASKNVSTSSKLYGSGIDFILNQNTYGVNALLMLGVSINESNWGNSSIAQNKNNIFGHGAVDSNASFNAYTYSNRYESIKYHAKSFISDGYLDVLDWRYFGPHLGDKESGMLKYASDPYWGEKAASRGYYIEDYFNNRTYDYGFYKIGVVSGNVSIYQSPNTNKEIYSTGNSSARNYKTNDVPLIILDTVTGQSVNGNNTWYKVQSDNALSENRSTFVRDGDYLFIRDYGYVHSSNVRIINQSNSQIPNYNKGDVNGDGKVNSLDYVQIENHIMARKKLVGDSLQRADVNKDGKVNSLDYVQIENHIMGRKPLF